MDDRFVRSLFVTFSIFFAVFQLATASTVAVHDPSIVIAYKDASGNSYPANDAAGTRTKYYYVFGTQVGAAYSRDMLNWTPFTPSFSINGTITTNYYNLVKAEADYAEHTTSDDVRGNLWAPDVIYNKALGKWTMYFSLSGAAFKSSIILFTASKIEGPYERSGVVVYGGFTNSTTSAARTDYAKVTGSSTVDGRYLDNNGVWDNTYSVSCIDPAVSYDESGKLWMSYGSWSGGIFLLKLSETTGLRDYSYNYGRGTSPVWSGTTLKFDPYMGVHIGGGYYVSGEGSYIKYFKDANGTGFYYLFVSMGFFAPDGGYTMRVFRSSTIDGDYKDVTGDDAAFSSYVFNYGNNVKYGMPIMQNFKYSWWTIAQVAQGHNSLLRDEDGSMYMIYHTKQDNGTAFHNVEVHQLFFNEKGWPLAAPFEYRQKFGLTTKTYTAEDIAGKYSIIVHSPVDYANLKSNLEQPLYLNADGTITGTYTGTWAYNYANGSQFLTLTTSAGTFQSVIGEQLMDGLSTISMAFTGMNAANELCLWGYRNTTTATTTTTNYRGSSLLVGAKDYSLTYSDYAKFNQTKVTGDFEIEYTFVNNTLAAENWHNWALAFQTTSETWYMRADAFSNSTFSGTTVNYWYNWTWDVFKTVFQNKEVRVKVQRIGTTINVYASVGGKLVYTTSSVNSPTGALTVYLGGETCYLDVKKISASQLGARQTLGTANDDGTYTAPFNTLFSPTTSVTGDFELNYSFNNYHNIVNVNNWENYIIRAISGSTSTLIRADAYAMNTIGTLAYTYDWDWANFLPIISGAQIALKISRTGGTITYTALITAKDGKVYNYQVVNTQAPTGAMSFGFTNETNFLDFFEVEKVSYVGTDVVTGNPSQELLSPSNLYIYAADQVLYIRAKEAGQASVATIDGKSISTISYTSGTTTVHGLPSGMYLVNSTKVLIR
jgi:beta-xylosidase